MAENISGSTTSNLTLVTVSPVDAGIFDVVVTNSQGSVTSSIATLTVTCPTITLNPAFLPGGAVGVAYAQNISPSGGAAPYVFTVSGGDLPPGTSLSGSGVLSGTPNNQGKL